MERTQHDEDRDVTDLNEKLPPIDGGPAAWKVVIASGLIECFFWGFVLSFGVFQAFYSEHVLFREDERQIPVIGPVIAGIAHMGFPFVSTIALRYPQYQVHLIWLGWALCLGSIVLTSFARNVAHLIFAQGVLYGVGWVIFYVPILMVMNEWWVVKRGRIYGIVYGCSGIGALFMPYLLSTLLHRFDFRITLRITAIAIALLTGPALPFLKSRIPKANKSNHVKPKPMFTMQTLTAFRNPIFVIFAVATFIQGSSFFLPRFFLPQYAHDIPNLGPQDSSTLLAIWAVSQIVGQMSLGALADHVSIFVPATMSAAVSALATLLLWGSAKGFWQLAGFAAIYGGFAGSYSVVWSRTTMALGRDKEEATLMFAVFSVERGVGNLIAGPISAVLLRDRVDVSQYGLGRYGRTVVFVGVTMAVASLTCVGWLWRDRLVNVSYEAVKGDDAEERWRGQEGEQELEGFAIGEEEEEKSEDEVEGSQLVR